MSTWAPEYTSFEQKGREISLEWDVIHIEQLTDDQKTLIGGWNVSHWFKADLINFFYRKGRTILNGWKMMERCWSVVSENIRVSMKMKMLCSMSVWCERMCQIEHHTDGFLYWTPLVWRHPMMCCLCWFMLLLKHWPSSSSSSTQSHSRRHSFTHIHLFKIDWDIRFQWSRARLLSISYSLIHSLIHSNTYTTTTAATIKHHIHKRCVMCMCLLMSDKPGARKPNDTILVYYKLWGKFSITGKCVSMSLYMFG